MFTMSTLDRLSLLGPTELASIRDRLAVQRPLHCSEALRLVEALEAAWAELQTKPARPTRARETTRAK